MFTNMQRAGTKWVRTFGKVLPRVEHRLHTNARFGREHPHRDGDGICESHRHKVNPYRCWTQTLILFAFQLWENSLIKIFTSEGNFDGGLCIICKRVCTVWTDRELQRCPFQSLSLFLHLFISPPAAPIIIKPAFWTPRGLKHQIARVAVKLSTEACAAFEASKWCRFFLNWHIWVFVLKMSNILCFSWNAKACFPNWSEHSDVRWDSEPRCTVIQFI